MKQQPLSNSILRFRLQIRAGKSNSESDGSEGTISFFQNDYFSKKENREDDVKKKRKKKIKCDDIDLNIFALSWESAS